MEEHTDIEMRFNAEWNVDESLLLDKLLTAEQNHFTGTPGYTLEAVSDELEDCPHTRFAGQKNNLYNGKG